MIPKNILKEAKDDAELIFVGKKAGSHPVSQEEIEKLMIRKAREGKVVARLKGGDPFIFGRGGEEARALAEAGIEFEVVPGISSVNAISAASLVPLTVRGISSILTVTTGMEARNKMKGWVNLKKIARLGGTIVILMPLNELSKIRKELMEVLPPSTPISIVEKATLPEGRILTTTLSNMVEDALHFKFQAPMTLIMGDVVHLGSRLRKFLRASKKVLVPRPKRTLERIQELVRSAGYSCDAIPIAEPKPLKFDVEADADYIAFTSQISAKLVIEKGSAPRGKTIAIGPGTATVLEMGGIQVDLIPENYNVKGLINLFSMLKPGKAILFRSADANYILESHLKDLGFQVISVRTHRIEETPEARIAADRLLGESYDALVATSSIMTKIIDSKLREINSSLSSISKRIKIISIGPATTKTLKSLNAFNIFEAPIHSSEGIVKTLEVTLG